MDTAPKRRNGEVHSFHLGVCANLQQDGYTIHLKLNDRACLVLGSPVSADELAPTDAPTLVGMAVFEDCVAWMVGVYHNHRHVERRMRNLKSDLPIRPLYLHRDNELVALCFVSLLSLTLYTLIERDVQADPELVAEGLRTTDALLAAMFWLGVECLLHPLRLRGLLVQHAHSHAAADCTTVTLARPRHLCASRPPEPPWWEYGDAGGAVSGIWAWSAFSTAAQ